MNKYYYLFSEPTVEELVLEKFNKTPSMRLSHLVMVLNEESNYKLEVIDAVNKLIKENRVKVLEIILAYNVKIKDFSYDVVLTAI